MANPDMTRVRAVLRDAVRLSTWTNRDIERKFGWSAGYMSRLFGGRIDLRVEHVLIICDTIGIKPGALFQIACPPPEGKSAYANIVLALSRLHPEKKAEPEPAPAPPPQPAKPSEEDLETAVLRALRKILVEKASG
jgi:hypothetical protein